MTDSNDISRGTKLLQVFWPIALAAAVGGASVVQAGAVAKEVERRVTEIETNGPAVMRERLARIEAKQDSLSETMKRMETTLDELDKRSRNSNLRGL